MKKFFTLALLCLFTIVTYGATSGTVGNYAYSFDDDGTATISGFGYGITDITELEIPETVTYGGDDYIVTRVSHDLCNAPNYYAAILTYVSIPSTVVEIGYRAFNGQTSLTTIYCYPEEVPTLTTSNGVENVFNNVTATVYVPAASLEAYQEAWGATYTGLTFVAIDEGGSEPEPTEYVLSFYPENGGEMTIPEGGLKEVVVSCEDGISGGSELSGHTWRVGGNEYAVSVSKVVPADDGKSLTFSLSSALTYADTYSLQYRSGSSWISNLPAGMFLLGANEVESEAMTYSFTLVAAEEPEPTVFEYSFDPADGSEVYSLRSIEFTCETGVTCNYMNKESRWGDAKLYDAQNREVAEVVYVTPIGDYQTKTYTGFTFTLGQDLSGVTITDLGDYYFVLPAGYIAFYDGQSGKYIDTTEDVIAHYTIIEDTYVPQDLSFTIDPADESEVTSLRSVSFYREAGLDNRTGGIDSFSSARKAGEDGDVPMSSIAVYDENWEEVTSVGSVSEDYDENWESYSIAIHYTFKERVVDPGKYYVTIPAGSFVIHEEGRYFDNEEMILTYYVLGGDEAESGLVFDPASGSVVETLSGFKATCDEGLSISLEPGEGIGVYNSSSVELTYAEYVENDLDDDGFIDEIVFTFVEEITEEGVYYVYIPAGYIQYGLTANEEMYLTYYVGSSAANNEALYKQLCEEIDRASDYLDDTWLEIQSEYPEVVAELESTYNSIASQLTSLQMQVDMQHNAGILETTADDDEAQLESIVAAIADLLAVARGEETGIHGVSSDYSDVDVYTLGGQKVVAPLKKGVYIVGGKKVLVK